MTAEELTKRIVELDEEHKKLTGDLSWPEDPNSSLWFQLRSNYLQIGNRRIEGVLRLTFADAYRLHQCLNEWFPIQSTDSTSNPTPETTKKQELIDRQLARIYELEAALKQEQARTQEVQRWCDQRSRTIMILSREAREHKRALDCQRHTLLKRIACQLCPLCATGDVPTPDSLTRTFHHRVDNGTDECRAQVIYCELQPIQ